MLAEVVQLCAGLGTLALVLAGVSTVLQVPWR